MIIMITHICHSQLNLVKLISSLAAVPFQVLHGCANGSNIFRLLAGLPWPTHEDDLGSSTAWSLNSRAKGWTSNFRPHRRRNELPAWLDFQSLQEKIWLSEFWLSEDVSTNHCHIIISSPTSLSRWCLGEECLRRDLRRIWMNVSLVQKRTKGSMRKILRWHEMTKKRDLVWCLALAILYHVLRWKILVPSPSQLVLPSLRMSARSTLQWEKRKLSNVLLRIVFQRYRSEAEMTLTLLTSEGMQKKHRQFDLSLSCLSWIRPFFSWSWGIHRGAAVPMGLKLKADRSDRTEEFLEGWFLN